MKFSRKVALNAPFKDYLGKDDVSLLELTQKIFYSTGCIPIPFNYTLEYRLSTEIAGTFYCLKSMRLNAQGYAQTG